MFFYRKVISFILKTLFTTTKSTPGYIRIDYIRLFHNLNLQVRS